MSNSRPLQKLVLVAGHAVYFGRDRSAATEDSAWCLQRFQAGDPIYYLEHIRLGVELAAASPQSLLIFSGGQTRLEAGPRSEAEGYFALAEQFAWWQRPEVRGRTATEDFARDSFENLLFGIARFREVTGRYPTAIDVVSWAFKRERFDLHRQTLRWPENAYTYHGPNNPDNPESALACEAKTFAAFKLDPFGSEEPVRSKRESRNPFRRTIPYPTTCPEIAPLLQHMSGMGFTSPLPWNSLA